MNSLKGIPTQTIKSFRSYAFTNTKENERRKHIIKGYRREERTVLVTTTNGENVTKMSPFNDISDGINGMDSTDDVEPSKKDTVNHQKHPQDWTKVKNHAWTLLVTISIKCFIEGIAFVLTLQDSFTAGLAFLVAMIVKLFPLEPGYAIILSQAFESYVESIDFRIGFLKNLKLFKVMLG